MIELLKIKNWEPSHLKEEIFEQVARQHGSMAKWQHISKAFRQQSGQTGTQPARQQGSNACNKAGRQQGWKAASKAGRQQG
jgi:hypothetical protein